MFSHLRMRGRAGISRAKMPMLREAKQVRHYYHSKSVAVIYDEHQLGENFTESSINDDKINDHQESSANWVPHPRTGIYFPAGHEWVMADVPKTAASFNRAFWLRNDDGVDIPDPDPDTHHSQF